MSRDTVSRTLTVALAVCITCSVIVSIAAVLLRPAQLVNKELDKKRNILAAAGLLREGESIESQFANIRPRLVDLETGEFSDEFDAASFDQRRASGDPQLSRPLTAEEDLAKISRRERYAVVYMVVSDAGEIEQVILPVHGYGLWSTMYGFLAVRNDFNTVSGLGFYEHGETPGLGGEIDNPRWKKLWGGKRIFAAGEVGGEVALTVIKGTVSPSRSGSEHLIDGLAGATLTVRGVDQLIKFWLGDMAFGPFLRSLKSGGL